MNLQNTEYIVCPNCGKSISSNSETCENCNIQISLVHEKNDQTAEPLVESQLIPESANLSRPVAEKDSDNLAEHPPKLKKDMQYAELNFLSELESIEDKISWNGILFFFMWIFLFLSFFIN